MAQPQTMMVDNTSRHSRRADKLKQDEDEIAKLEREMRGEKDDDSESEEQEVQSEEDGNESSNGEPKGKSTDKENSQSTEQEEDSEDEEEKTSKPETPEEKTFKKRYGDLRRHLAAKEKEWEEKFAKLEKAQGNTKVIPPKTNEDLEAWAEKYPDVAGIVHTIAEQKAKELFDKAEQRLKEFDEAQYDAAIVKAETSIRKAHSDFDKLRESDEFHNWVEKQPKWMQDALYENADDASSVIRVIDLYKVDKGITPSARREKAKDAAKSVSSSDKPKVSADESGKKIRESEVARWSDKEFEERLDELTKAQQEGRFIYDVSGGAR